MAPTKKTVQKKNEQGFALLMTLIVVTVVVAIGITVLDLSTKQIRLSTNAKDSEIAFHAANAGMECARYWRRQESYKMEHGTSILPSCFGSSLYSNNKTDITASYVTGDGEAYKYDYSFTWAGDTRCTQVTTVVASSTDTGSPSLADVVIDMNRTPLLIDGYPELTKTCKIGEKCTILSVRGYNKPCNNASGYGTVQREVLLQF